MAKEFLPKNTVFTAVEYMQSEGPTFFQENI
jgi:hypothetical protein